MSPLEQYPQIRKHLYIVQWTVNLVLGVLALVFLMLDRTPQWLLISQAAFNFVWTYTGLTASANTPAPEVHPGERGATDVGAIIRILAVVAFFLVILFVLRLLIS